MKRGEYFVVKTFKADYKNPAHFGDTITCETRVKKITAAQIYFSQVVRNKLNKQVLVESEIVLVVVNKHLKPILLPDEVDLLLRETIKV